MDAQTKEALRRAILGTEYELSKEILERFPQVDVNQVNFENGQVALHCVSKHCNCLDFVKYLVQARNANVNVKDSFGRIPLTYAAKTGNLDVFMFFEMSDADMSAKDNDGRTVFMYAADGGHLNICQYLEATHSELIHLKDNRGLTALFFAADRGHLNVCQFLATTGAELTAQDKFGITPLMMAASQGHLNVCKFFCEAGVELSMRTKDGMTAFMYGCNGGHVRVCQFLQEHDVDINCKAIDGDTGLLLAVRNNQWDVCEYLLDQNVNLEDEDYFGRTALEYVYTHYDLLKRFCQKGATLPNHVRMDPRTKRYVENQAMRMIIVGLVSVKNIRRLGKYSAIKMLNVDLISMVFAMLVCENGS
jgi:ankyrin repeat protein